MSVKEIAARRALVLARCVLGMCLAAGCATPNGYDPPPYRVVMAPHYNPAMCHRLLLLPLAGLDNDPVAAAFVYSSLCNELQTVGPFEVIQPEPVFCEGCPSSCPAGGPLPASLAALTERYRPDAFVFTTITEYSPYRPVRLGVSIQVVGAWDGVTLASIDTLRQASEDVPRGRPDFLINNYASQLKVAEAAVAESSPRFFARHVTAQIAGALAAAPVPPPVEMLPAGALQNAHVPMRASGSGW